MAIVLILDDDLGFVFWAAQALTSAGFESIPAQSVAEAKKLFSKLPVTIDVLILSPAVKGAFEYTRALRAANPLLGVIAAVERASDLVLVRREVDAIRSKPEVLDQSAMPEWRRTVRRVFARRTGEVRRKASGHDSP